jgi:hypothetical protein
MLHRRLPDPRPLAEADLDTPDMVEAVALVTLNEQHLRMLARMAEVGMEMIEAIAQNAKTDPATASAAPDAFCKISQAVRRTIALHDKLARDVKSDRDGLRAARDRRRAHAAETYREAKDEAIVGGLGDALHASSPDTDAADFEPLLFDAEESLGDPDELRGYLHRPVGETVATLCAALGLDPDICRFDGKDWTVRRPPSEFEARREAFRRKGAERAVDPMSALPDQTAARAPP